MRSVQLRRLLLAAAATCAIAPASAQATTVYPAGGTFAFASSSIAFQTSFGVTTCTMSGGSLTVPAAPGNSAAGAVALPLSAPPTFSGCVGGLIVSASASGTWTLSPTWGPPSTATLAIPARGLTLVFGGTGATAVTSAVVTLSGPWSNGLTSPFVDSVFSNDAFGGLPLTWTGGSFNPVGIVRGSHPLTSTTPGSVLLVGP